LSCISFLTLLLFTKDDPDEEFRDVVPLRECFTTSIERPSYALPVEAENVTSFPSTVSLCAPALVSPNPSSLSLDCFDYGLQDLLSEEANESAQPSDEDVIVIQRYSGSFGEQSNQSIHVLSAEICGS
jgi:hypothetical protein